MAGEKVTSILKAKSPFSSDEIEAMADGQGWDWVYANAKPKKEKFSQVCFTGFSALEKAELAILAQASHIEVVGSVTKDLAFLCAGENAGPSKLEKAKEQGVHVLNRQEFEHLVDTGEITKR